MHFQTTTTVYLKKNVITWVVGYDNNVGSSISASDLKNAQRAQKFSLQKSKFCFSFGQIIN